MWGPVRLVSTIQTTVYRLPADVRGRESITTSRWQLAININCVCCECIDADIHNKIDQMVGPKKSRLVHEIYTSVVSPLASSTRGSCASSVGGGSVTANLEGGRRLRGRPPVDILAVILFLTLPLA